MAYQVKLSRGTSYIDLTSGRYAADFIPPREMGTYVFDVRILGGSSAELQRAKKDLEAFINFPDDIANPLYLEWKPDNYAGAEPVWGQFGSTKKAEIIVAYVDWWDNYQLTQYGNRGGKLIVTCNLGPIEGKRQLLANAKGGICEDWIGTTDGTSRGVQIPVADATNGNKMTNPIFGHSTYNNGWTAGAGITVAKSANPPFVLFGLFSAKLTCNSATVADNEFTQSINVGNTNAHVLSCYAKLPDSSAISATQCALTYNGATITTTYTSVGNGWYRLSGSLTGANAARTFGIRVVNQYTVYVDAWQLEEYDRATSFFYGDMLGCSWNSTPHDSKSLRATPVLGLSVGNTLLNNAAGTIRIIWKAPFANTVYTDPVNYLFYCGNNFRIYYGAINDQWEYFFGGGGVIVSDTFVAGDIRIIHATWSPAAINLYVNGTKNLISGAYEAATFASILNIGSSDTGTFPLNGTFMGFEILDHTMTDAEVAADYANVSQLIADGQSLGGIPYLWSASADGVVQNADDGTNQNWAVVGGIQGDLPADVEMRLITSTNSDDVYIGNLDCDYKRFIDPEFLTYYAATVDEISVNTDTALATIPLDNDEFEIMKGRYLSVMVRGDEDATGNNLFWRTGVNPGGAYYYTDYLASSWIASASNDFSIDLSPQIALPEDEQLFNLIAINRAVTVTVHALRTPAGALTFRLQTAQIVPYPMVRLANISGGSATVKLYIKDRSYEVDSSYNLYYSHETRGDLLRFVPGRYNILVSYIGREAIASTNDETLTYNLVMYTPRWSTM